MTVVVNVHMFVSLFHLQGVIVVSPDHMQSCFFSFLMGSFFCFCFLHYNRKFHFDLYDLHLKRERKKEDI